MKVAGRQIPNLVGLKYSHDDLVDLAACVALDDGRFEVLFGKDEILLAALVAGCARRTSVAPTISWRPCTTG